MIEKIALKIFWGAAFVCACFVLTAIWSGDEPSEILMKGAATAFIIGFAAFIVWAPLVAYRFHSKL